ncbi:MAG: hypothetical protein PHY92_00355 [Alphaproteobacteria bacterium]|nr:hypothetical protein [Alphaproteobacteria bacterium]
MILASLARNEIHRLPPKEHRARRLAIVILALAPLAFGLLALYLGQDANWDLRNYHWYNAYAFANGRYMFDLLPSQTPFFYNPTLDVPFYLLASHVSARMAGFVLGAVQGLNFVLLFMLAHVSLIVPNPRQKVLACAVLAALGMLGGGGIAQIGTTFYDNITSLGIFLSALLVVRHFETLIHGPLVRAAGIAFLAGFPAGLMMGLKLPSVIFCLGLCFALLLVAGPARRRFAVSFVFGLGVLAGLALSLGHWAWFLQTHFQSPLFPYFNNFFQSPLAPLTSARDTQFVPLDWHDRLLFPFIYSLYPARTGEIPFRDLAIPVLYALLPVAVVLRLVFGRSANGHDRLAVPHAARYLLWASAIAYAVWVPLFAIYRYVVPLEMLAPLLIVFAAGLLPLRLPTRGLLAAFILLAVAVTVQPGNWTRKNNWLDRAVEIERPALPDTPDIMILMAGFEPYSHVVSEFPPRIPFVRIQSNFASPQENKGINAMIKTRLDAHKGRFMLLILGRERHHAGPALAHFGLKFLPQTCQKVIDRLYDDPLDLCDVERTTPGTPHD